jgi:two-component system KDP operon response regulator KdpE
MGELQARIRAALRRVTPGDERPVITTTAFTVDLSAKRVTTTGGDEVRLTPIEWHLLEILVRHAGKLVGHRQLLGEVWGPRYETETSYLRVHMANLRRKLEPDPTRPRYLLTDPGLGYRFALHRE